MGDGQFHKVLPILITGPRLWVRHNHYNLISGTESTMYVTDERMKVAYQISSHRTGLFQHVCLSTLDLDIPEEQ